MQIPGKLRRNLARHERNLRADQCLSYQISTAYEPAAISTAMAEFLTLESSGWKGESGTAILNDSSLTQFYEGLLQFADTHCALEVHQLYLGSTCVAAQLALRCETTLYLLKIAYDEQHAAHSPGSLLLRYALQHSTQDNTQILSLVSAPDWASRWKPHKNQVWHVTRFSNNVQGAIRKKTHSIRTGITDQLRETRDRMKP